MRQILRVTACFVAVLALFAASAHAQYRQYKPAEQTAVGEAYHAEFSFDFWSPDPTLTISANSLGIIGNQIDAVTDLGFVKTRFRELKVTLRPGKKHKFRFDYTPITFVSDNWTLKRDIVYNGIKYSANLPVNSQLALKQYGFAYEFDFLYQPRWFAGVVLGAKWTQVHSEIQSPVDRDNYDVQAPIPSIGGVFRGYVMKNLAVTVQYDYFKLPSSVDQQGRYAGRTSDLNIYGTINVTNNFGAQIGYRSTGLTYKAADNTGDFALKGIYFGGVARF